MKPAVYYIFIQPVLKKWPLLVEQSVEQSPLDFKSKGLLDKPTVVLKIFDLNFLVLEYRQYLTIQRRAGGQLSKFVKNRTDVQKNPVIEQLFSNLFFIVQALKRRICNEKDENSFGKIKQLLISNCTLNIFLA